MAGIFHFEYSLKKMEAKESILEQIKSNFISSCCSSARTRHVVPAHNCSAAQMIASILELYKSLCSNCNDTLFCPDNFALLIHIHKIV
jgi:hypothetical protein